MESKIESGMESEIKQATKPSRTLKSTNRICGAFAFRCLLGVGVLSLFGTLTGCETPPPQETTTGVTAQKQTIAAPPVNQTVVAEQPTLEPKRTAPLKRSKTPVRDALENAIAEHPQVFPKDTTVLGINLNRGVATVDFGPEFNRLASMGDANEGEAQKILRHALIPIKNIEKMRVTVQGREFNSPNTDWYTPFPVYMEGEDIQNGTQAQPAPTIQPTSQAPTQPRETPFKVLTKQGPVAKLTPGPGIPPEMISDVTPIELKSGR